MSSNGTEVHPPEREARGPDGGPAVGTRLSADEIYENVRTEAEEELRRPPPALFWSSLAAGLTIGFSFLASAFLASLVSPPYRIAAAAAGYPLGFIFVVLARNQLFTENTLEPIIPLLHRPSGKSFRSVGALWATVLLGNLLGAVIIAGFLARTRMLGPELQPTLLAQARHALEGGFWLVAFRAIFAGWLIALMAWLIASTKATGAQLVLVWVTTAPISALGFRHSIAGSVEAFYLAWGGQVGWGQALWGFTVPAVLGNVLGGVLLVALLNYGQVAAGRANHGGAQRAH